MLVIIISGYIKPNILWNLTDFFVALLVIINVYAILKITKNNIQFISAYNYCIYVAICIKKSNNNNFLGIPFMKEHIKCSFSKEVKMNKRKLETITNLFEGREIRSIWNSEKEDYYFSVVDVIAALTSSNDPKDYWYRLKKRMNEEEKSELSTNCRQLKMKAKDGKLRMTEVLDTEGIFRLIESVPSPKAEPFKLWLAKLGREEIDNIFDPSIGMDKMIDYYLKKGYSLNWIMLRFKAIIDRKKLTNKWQESGLKHNNEYAILTNEIYKEWSGMTASEYKKYKNIRKENLRDNMTDIEVALTDLSEIVTRKLVTKNNPIGFNENKKIAKLGGEAAKAARNNIEKNLGETVISKNNNLNYNYIDNNLKFK